MTSAETGNDLARLLFRADAVHVSRQQPFILAAGWASPLYVDCRVLVGEPELRQSVTDIAAAYLQATFPPDTFDAIAGAETAGIPFAAWLADRTRLKMRYVRKRQLGIGRNAQVEGGTVDGLKVLLLDDLTTDGSSKVGFARGLRAAGAIVEQVLTLFYHDVFPGTEERLREAGLELHALTTSAAILQADAGKYFSPEDRAEIECFLADPITWSARHGGRASLTPRV